LAKLREREMIEENKKELLKVLLLTPLTNSRTPKPKTRKPLAEVSY
jgi:hypothetical protein